MIAPKTLCNTLRFCYEVSAYGTNRQCELSDGRTGLDAWDIYCEWQWTNKATLKRIKDIRRDPFDGIGKSESLKYDIRPVELPYQR